MLKVITLGDPRLRERSVVVDPSEVRGLVKHMFQTMYEEEGIGLAAVQVGRLLRVFIGTSIEEQTSEEGCLSIPGVRADVTRSADVSVQATDLNGRAFRVNAQGLLARAIQHELDHLNGVLFVDHLSKHKRDELLADYEK